jgi:hypothetical protein
MESIEGRIKGNYKPILIIKIKIIGTNQISALNDLTIKAML